MIRNHSYMSLWIQNLTTIPNLGQNQNPQLEVRTSRDNSQNHQGRENKMVTHSLELRWWEWKKIREWEESQNMGMFTNEEWCSLYRPNMAIRTSHWVVPLGLPLGTRLFELKVAPSLGLGLAPLVSPNSDRDNLGTQHVHDFFMHIWRCYNRTKLTHPFLEFQYRATMHNGTIIQIAIASDVYHNANT